MILHTRLEYLLQPQPTLLRRQVGCLRTLPTHLICAYIPGEGRERVLHVSAVGDRGESEHVLDLGVVLGPRRSHREKHGCSHRVPHVESLFIARFLEDVIDYGGHIDSPVLMPPGGQAGSSF